MVKTPQSESSAFTMSSEDFPALPGTTMPTTTSANDTTGKIMENRPPSSNTVQGDSQERVERKRGILTSPDGNSFCDTMVIRNIILF